MSETSFAKPDYKAIWNGPAGDAWVELAPLLDRIYAPFERLLVNKIPGGAMRVLDIGCGSGATTLSAAAAHPMTLCVGVDVSAPLINLARSRAQEAGLPVDFIVADAQTHCFRGRFDAIISRFGTLFFSDPIAAFVNLRIAAAPGAQLVFFAWRSVEQNSFQTIAESAAKKAGISMPSRRDGESGQFLFADRNRIVTVLSDSGWHADAIDPVDVRCAFDSRDLRDYSHKIGPLKPILESADPTLRSKLESALHEAFAPYVLGPKVEFSAACWFVTATALPRQR